ncbi:hypothetical protein RU99_GL001432 [Enterococcus casseliflavus]|nr:hypothetical protein RU99_GL001432 [Enterococcus casseliflavus]
MNGSCVYSQGKRHEVEMSGSFSGMKKAAIGAGRSFLNSCQTVK